MDLQFKIKAEVFETSDPTNRINVFFVAFGSGDEIKKYIEEKTEQYKSEFADRFITFRIGNIEDKL